MSGNNEKYSGWKVFGLIMIVLIVLDLLIASHQPVVYYWWEYRWIW